MNRKLNYRNLRNCVEGKLKLNDTKLCIRVFVHLLHLKLDRNYYCQLFWFWLSLEYTAFKLIKNRFSSFFDFKDQERLQPYTALCKIVSQIVNWEFPKDGRQNMGKSDQCALQKLKIRIQLSSPRISTKERKHVEAPSAVEHNTNEIDGRTLKQF